MDYSPFYNKTWDDLNFGEFSPHQKLIFIYLITNKNCKVSGIYETNPRIISFDTGIEANEVLDTLKRFNNKCIEYNPELGIIFVKKLFKYRMNTIGNPKVMLACLTKNYKLVPHKEFWDEFLTLYANELEVLKEKSFKKEGGVKKKNEEVAKKKLEGLGQEIKGSVKTSLSVNQDLLSISIRNSNSINTNNINNSNITLEKKSKSKLKFDDFQLQVAKQLGEHVKSIKQINLKMGDIKRWANDIRLLQEKDLKPRKNSSESIKKVIKAIIDNTGIEYFPEIESGKSLRDKFTKVEAFLKRQDAPQKKFSSSAYEYVPRELSTEDLEKLERTRIRGEVAKRFKCNPVDLTQDQINQYQKEVAL